VGEPTKSRRTKDKKTPAGAGPGSAAARPPTPAQLADEVRALAADVPAEGWFGDSKVFIAAAYDAYRARHGDLLSLEGFKDLLVEANRLGHLQLARADLVEAMDPALVRRSLTTYHIANFHFIRVPPRRRP
jgi:hypothetical protein